MMARISSRTMVTLAAVALAASSWAPGASAATVEPTPHELRVLEHNIAGGPKFKGSPEALNGINDQITKFGPDVVVLTEVCASQRNAFAAEHPDWTLHFTEMVPSSSCADDGESTAPQGQLIASPHPMTNLQTIPLGQTDQNVDADGTVLKEKVFNMVCGDVAVPGHTATGLRACGVHLIAFQEPVEGWIPKDRIGARTKQIETMAGHLNTWVADGKAVTVAGDFNTTPWKPTIDALYQLKTDGTFNGPGWFHEADQTDNKWFDTRPSGVECRENKQCRTGQATLSKSKYDYAFVSRNVTHRGEVSALSTDKYGSDHSLYRALFNIIY